MPAINKLEQTSLADARELLVPGCQTFDMRSSTNGEAYQIFVSAPDCPPPACGFPVIYVLDGNAEFLTVAETVKRAARRPKATGILPMVVVGIGYPDTESYNLARRYRDFTRGMTADEDFTDIPAGGCGGQGSYINFLQQDLLPHINRSFPVDPASCMLLGHSLAGYFALDLLAQLPQMFAGYISFSPSVWWDRPQLMDSIAKAPTPAHAIRLYAAVGEREQGYSGLRRRRRMVDNTREAVAAVDRRFAGSISAKFDIGLDEDHATVVPAMLCRALRFMCGVPF